jgi:hypothetical protein
MTPGKTPAYQCRPTARDISSPHQRFYFFTQLPFE